MVFDRVATEGYHTGSSSANQDRKPTYRFSVVPESPSPQLPPHQPKHPPTQRLHRLQHALRRVRSNETPSDSHPHSRPRFIQRPQRRLKPKPSIATGATESFGKI
jgi:hypothetical protein